MVYHIAFLVAALAAIIGIALYTYRQRRRLERERTVLLLQQEALQEQSELLQETLERCRVYREEIAQMMAASGLFYAGEAQPAVEGSAGTPEAEDEDPYETGVYCENPIVQAVLQHKEVECRRRKIPLLMDLEGIDAVNAEDMDLVGIIYNLLDNAIEASLRLPDPRDRRVMVSSRIEKKSWILSVENRCVTPDEKSIRRGTWKEDAERHGIGQTILRDLVRENRGQIQISQNENSYQVKIRMPIRREAA